MRVELRKWSMADKQALITICNQIDRSYLSDRLPNPYTEVSADWWLHRVEAVSYTHLEYENLFHIDME